MHHRLVAAMPKHRFRDVTGTVLPALLSGHRRGRTSRQRANMSERTTHVAAGRIDTGCTEVDAAGGRDRERGRCPDALHRVREVPLNVTRCTPGCRRAICPEELMGQEGWARRCSITGARRAHRTWPVAGYVVPRQRSAAPSHPRTPFARRYDARRWWRCDVAMSVGGRCLVAHGGPAATPTPCAQPAPAVAGQGVELAVASPTPQPALPQCHRRRACYVQSGSGVVESVFGTPPVGAGDHV